MKITDEQLRELSTTIDKELYKIEDTDVGFCLLVFPFGEIPTNRIIYSSNAQRDLMIKALEEFVANHKATHPDDVAPVQVQ